MKPELTHALLGALVARSGGSVVVDDDELRALRRYYLEVDPPDDDGRRTVRLRNRKTELELTKRGDRGRRR